MLDFEGVPMFYTPYRYNYSWNSDHINAENNNYRLNSFSLLDHGITGSNQIVTFQTIGSVDLNHSFFTNGTSLSDDEFGVPFNETIDNHRKIKRYDFLGEEIDYSISSTFAAGLIAGKPYNYADSDDKNYSGVALDSKLHVIEMNQTIFYESSVLDLGTTLDMMKKVGSYICANNFVFNNKFWSYSEDINYYAWKNKDILYIYPSGDTGDVILSPGDALNALTVGSCQNITGNPSETSSKGPTLSASKKPDVVAPGEGILSSLSRIPFSNSTIDSLVTLNGSIASTAQIAGIAALVRQYFVDGFYPTLSAKAENSMIPSSALIKSVIINSARNTSASPLYDPKNGFGIPFISDA
ncbi:Clan SB, family S8, subtilisin-like serine peptidase [Trichomonas vaginalis G3]|uniref:Clan SB, family S8, subtilisin-like serine peptidase n=1 Tax=Trichomonas vaginalis (strain ATCC PRA-98 / G3) TaxID=412133 RepID=A2EZQ1_TRIV3|nr:peptidases S8 Kp43 protease domain-containing protein [Trichomonas vaginalis G3]EAY01889.1 Clan SB, family S8, subtilisin-like serine peptidase [Trichomonas vaginalis G3]KAI5549686.1 peptidases S8 Kp43 protease domain-containing protein [Trichomonas vaginalis G3]|eukprot:XP_001330432.1 Clan SB, family S8, subtilisin-like serine peptidase [Trichomonas vaginalis G3]